MARRRKKARAPKPTAGTPGGDKALPSLPPGAAHQAAFTPESEVPEDQPETQGSLQKSPRDRQPSSRNGASSSNYKRDVSPLSDDMRGGGSTGAKWLKPPTMTDDETADGPTLPASTYSESRPSNVSSPVDDDDESERGFLPMAFDPTPIPAPPLAIPRKQVPRTQELSPQPQKENQPPRDYFGTTGRLSAKSAVRDGTREEPRLETGTSASSRSVSTEREPERAAKPSPHILFQEKGRTRKPNASGENTPSSGPSSASPVVAGAQDKSSKLRMATDAKSPTQHEAFKLQEVPKTKKARSRSNSKAVSPIDTHIKHNFSTSKPISPISVGSQNSGVNPFDDPKHKAAQYPTASQYTSPAPIPPRNADRGLPLRGDSLAAALKAKQATPDPSTSNAPHSTSSHERNKSSSSVPSSSTDTTSTVSRDGSRSKPDPQLARSSIEGGPPPRSANRPTAPSKSVANDDFIAPRHAPPPPPAERHNHSHHDSISTMQSEDRPSIDGQLSPAMRSGGLPKYSLDAGFSMDDEMGRILRGENGHIQGNGRAASPSVLRRVSNAVKHGRSFSDRAVNQGGRSPRTGTFEPGTPSITSPASADGVEALRTSLRRAQNHIAELETEKNSLQEKLDASSDIRAVNSELREKRSTMAFLDTQREMVVRELEVMTDHLSKAKDNSKPLDLNTLKTSILKDFAESLQKLKDNMSTQIEDLMHKRNELTEEIGSLIQMKDKGFQEYESLSSKNAQLVQHNNELLRNIQGMYQENRAPNGGPTPASNGLGIYHPGAKVDATSQSEMRNLNLVSTDPSMPNLLHDTDAEPATVLTAPQVVNIRKGGKPNKFNWRRGGEKITGTLTKGIKGAFVGADRGPITNGPYSIGMPYNQTHQAVGGSDQGSMNSKQGLDGGVGQGLFPHKNGAGLGNMKHDNSSTNLVGTDGSSKACPRFDGTLPTLTPPVVLFGSELSIRCEYEREPIPGIVITCIRQVEKRGMDVEGVYRKSGGAGQVKAVQAGFEKDNYFNIGDQDLDIHAVTSTLKQYFRKLPTPLITYDVYDALLEAGQIQDKEKQAAALHMAVSDLPDAHRVTLGMLIQHLARVMSFEPKNLMTPLNLAVVFAPTIMRPLSIEREMSDMQVQRAAVQALLEHHEAVFGEDDD